MSANLLMEWPTDTHEHAAGLAEYRLLASECIRDAVKCLDYAAAYRPSVERLRDPNLRIYKHNVYKHLRSRFYAHRAQLEHDIDWFRAPDGYSLWVLATLLDEREAEGVRVEFLRRARPLLAYYHKVHRELRRQWR